MRSQDKDIVATLEKSIECIYNGMMNINSKNKTRSSVILHFIYRQRNLLFEALQSINNQTNALCFTCGYE